MATDIERPDPEVQAGRALRRLRLSQRWSQEEVARRMQAYGYDFHQTMIAKIEAAQRPLRVRELVDFAALYGVEVHELIHPPTSSLAEITQEIAEVEAQLTAAKEEVTAAAARQEEAQAALALTVQQYHMRASELAVLSERRRFLQDERDKFVRWDAGQEPVRDDTPESNPKPNPLTASTVAEFMAALRRYRTWAGEPAFRNMAKRAGHRVSYATMLAAMNGDALPRFDVTAAIVIGCGGSTEDLQVFATAWRRIASGERP